MWTQTLVVVAVWIASFGQTAGLEKQAAPTAAQNRLGELVAQGEGPYTKLGVGAWSTPYKGKSLPITTVRIAAADGGIFFFVDLFERKSITLSRNLLVKITELNSQFDYGKVVLSESHLQLRLDVRSKLMDVEEFKAMEQQTATLADEAFGVIKDFVQ
jgi:hypothetical protein